MAMAYSSTAITTLSQNCQFRVRNAPIASCKGQTLTHTQPAVPLIERSGRRQLLFSLTTSAALLSREKISMAQDIPLFGLRKSLKKAEEEAEVIVREGFEAVEKGLDTAEQGIDAAEQGIEAAEKGVKSAEKEIESALSFGGLAQAGVVAAAELVGVLVGTAVVNGILGPEAQKS